MVSFFSETFAVSIHMYTCTHFIIPISHKVYCTGLLLLSCKFLCMYVCLHTMLSPSVCLYVCLYVFSKALTLKTLNGKMRLICLSVCVCLFVYLSVC